MRTMQVVAVLAAVAFAAPALANMGGSSTPEPKQPTGSTVAASATLTPRQQAERDYGDAYNEIARAKKDAAEKKDKNAEKRYRKALERAQRAVETDSAYHEAWNLVGYASRRLGKHDQAVAAYKKSLGLRFDYAPAREYLGETYLEMKQLDKALEQHAILERLKATGEAAELMAAIASYRLANPAEAPAPAAASEANGTAVPAAADSAVTKP